MGGDAELGGISAPDVPTFAGTCTPTGPVVVVGEGMLLIGGSPAETAGPEVGDVE